MMLFWEIGYSICHQSECGSGCGGGGGGRVNALERMRSFEIFSGMTCDVCPENLSGKWSWGTSGNAVNMQIWVLQDLVCNVLVNMPRLFPFGVRNG